MGEQSAATTQADTRLYRAVHQTFRLTTDRFIEATERMEPSVLGPIIGTRWSFYAEMLDHHHHNEDDVAFPVLVEAKPDMKALVEQLAEEHRKLLARMDDVTSALAIFEKEPDLQRRTALHDAIVGVREEFFPHLDVEDAQIVPAIAASIPPAQWEKMDNDALKSIPRKWLSLAVGALDETIRGLPETERPLPPPPPIRVMLTLSWRRKWVAFIKPLLP